MKIYWKEKLICNRHPLKTGWQQTDRTLKGVFPHDITDMNWLCTNPLFYRFWKSLYLLNAFSSFLMMFLYTFTPFQFYGKNNWYAYENNNQIWLCCPSDEFRQTRDETTQSSLNKSRFIVSKHWWFQFVPLFTLWRHHLLLLPPTFL